MTTRMTARNFKAMAHRSGGWWALEVTGDNLPHPAYTQARRLDQAEGMVRDLLALHFATSEDAVGHIEMVPVLDAALDEELSRPATPAKPKGSGPTPPPGPGEPLSTWGTRAWPSATSAPCSASRTKP